MPPQLISLIVVAEPLARNTIWTIARKNPHDRSHQPIPRARYQRPA